MLASSSRTTIQRTQSTLYSIVSQTISHSRGSIPTCIHRRQESTAALRERYAKSSGAHKLRSGPWLFNPDHTFPSTYNKSPQARYQLQISQFADQGSLIDCLWTCRDMKENGVKPNLLIYNDILKVAAKDGFYTIVEGIMDDMIAMGIQPDRQSYHHLLHARRALRAESMWEIIERMKELNITPNAQTFALLLDRPIRAENLEMVLQYIGEMVTLGLVPELQTAHGAVILAAKLGNPRLAIEMANYFEDTSVRRLDNEVWLNCLISSADDLYAEGVLYTWRKVVNELGITPDEGLCLLVLQCVARHGLPDLGNEVLRVLKLIGASWKEHHLAAMIEAFCKANRLKEAFETLHVMRENGIIPVSETTHPIFNVIKQDIDSVDNVWSTLDEMREEGKGVDITAINVVIQASIFFGDIQRAVGTYKSIPDYGIKPNVDTFNLLLSACVAVGHRGLGDHLLGEMREAGIKPDARTYERLVILCLTQTTYEDAFFYLEEMKGHKFLPTLAIYEAIVKKCVSVGDTRFTLALDEMKQCGYVVSRSLREFIDRGGVFDDQPAQGSSRDGQGNAERKSL